MNERLRCIFETRKDTGVVAIQVWVQVGSKSEEEQIAGITHFIEHLIFKGTDKVKANEMASRIESLGGSINAFTSYDNTVYHIVVPSRAFEEGLDLLVDAVMNPAFPPEEIAKEIKVVLEEIKMGEDDPQRKLFKELFSLSYQGHPYGRPIIGYSETVGNLKRQDIKKYFGAHYVPENMTLVVVGDFNEKKARESLRRHVKEATVSPRTIAGKEDSGKTRAVAGDRTKIIEKAVRESYVALSYPIPSLTSEDTPALEVLGTILGEGESSRLQGQLKHAKGIVSNIATYLFTPKEAGLFVIFSTFKGKGHALITSAIDEEIERLLREGATEWEIEKAKNMIKASYVYGTETAQGRARQIGNAQTLTNDPDFSDKFLANVDKVTNADVKRVLEKYISGKRRSFVALLPKGAANPHSFQLKNGMRYVINRNAASPSLSFKIGFVGGLKEEPTGKNGIFNVLSRMLLKGTKEKDAVKIAREIDQLAGDITPFTGRNVFGLSGKFLKKDMGQAFSLLKDLLTSSMFKGEEAKKVREDVLSAIRQRDDDPISVAFMRFNQALYDGHPYGRDAIGEERDIQGIGPEELQKLYGDYVTPANAVLAVSGDIDEKELVSLLESLFSRWKGKGRALRKEPVTALKKEIHIEKDIMQAHMIFGFIGPGFLDEDRYPAEVMDAILSGMGGRIHKILREENPYAYALTFFNQMAYEVGGMGIYIGTDRKLTGKVEVIVKAEIERILKEGFTDKEVTDGKNYLIGNHLISLQYNSTISASMCFDTIYGLGPDHFKVWPTKIEMVTKDDVNRVARKYLSPDTMVQVTIGKQGNL